MCVVFPKSLGSVNTSLDAQHNDLWMALGHATWTCCMKSGSVEPATQPERRAQNTPGEPFHLPAVQLWTRHLPQSPSAFPRARQATQPTAASRVGKAGPCGAPEPGHCLPFL